MKFFETKETEVDNNVQSIYVGEAEKNPFHLDTDFLDSRLEAIDEFCLEFHKQARDRELKSPSNALSPDNSSEHLNNNNNRHNTHTKSNVLGGNQIQDINKEKH